MVREELGTFAAYDESEEIRGNQRESEGIRGNPRSEAVRLIWKLRPQSKCMSHHFGAGSDNPS